MYDKQMDQITPNLNNIKCYKVKVTPFIYVLPVSHSPNYLKSVYSQASCFRVNGNFEISAPNAS